MRLARLLLACAVLLGCAGPALASDPQLVFLVRHAEKAASAPAPVTGAPSPSMTAPLDDPPLSAAGHERAARLAAMLRSADIRNIFSTEFLRTRQTAAPTAQAWHLETIAVAAKDSDGLLAQLRQSKGNVLIVGHSNSVPDLLKRLGIREEVTIPETEYDNLFIVVRSEAFELSLVRLRY